MPPPDGLLQCRRCGWVHFAVTRAEVEAEVAEFNFFYARLTPAQRDAHRAPLSLASYEQCRRCKAPHHLARPVAAKMVPLGVTLLPLLFPQPAL
jgi:ribosomal protein L37E